MTTKKNSINCKQGVGKRVGIGTIKEIIIILAGAMILSALVSNETIEMKYVPMGTVIILAAASFIGTKTVSVLQNGEKIVAYLLCGVVLIALLFFGTILFFDCDYGNIGLPIGGVISGALVSFLTSVNKSKQRRTGMAKQRKRLYKMHNE